MNACEVCGAWLRRGEQACGRCGLPADAASRFDRPLAAPAERPSAGPVDAPLQPAASGEPATPPSTAPGSTPWAAPRLAGPPLPAASAPPAAPSRSWASPVAPGTAPAPAAPAPAPGGPWGPPPAPSPPVAPTAAPPATPPASPWTTPGAPTSPVPPGARSASAEPATLPPPIDGTGQAPPWSPPPGPPPGPGGGPPAGWTGPPRPPGPGQGGARVALIVVGAVVGSLVAIAFVCVLAVTLLGRDASDQFTTVASEDGAPWTSSAALAVGDCVAPDVGDITPVTPAEMVPVACSEPHRSEVFAQAAAGVDDAPYPGDAAIDRQADMFCYGAGFADFVGTDYDDSTLWASAHVPTEQTWAEGHRHTTCFVHPPSNEPTTGSFRDSEL